MNPSNNTDDNSDDDNFYEVDGDHANNADSATLGAAASTIFDNGTIVENPEAILLDEESSYTQSEPGDMETGQASGTRISTFRQVSLK